MRVGQRAPVGNGGLLAAWMATSVTRAARRDGRALAGLADSSGRPVGDGRTPLGGDDFANLGEKVQER